MLNRLIIFLVRKKLKLKKGQQFHFKNQANTADCYYFSDEKIVKVKKSNGVELLRNSNISLNFLLSDECINLMETNIYEK